MSDTQRFTPAQRQNVIIAAIVGVVVALALVLMFVTARANGEKEQQMQANCLESGGIYILDTGCIIPTAPTIAVD